MDDLKERLRKVEGSVEYGADPGGTVTCWHRNPDGLEALAHIEALEQRVSELEEALRPFATIADRAEKIGVGRGLQVTLVTVPVLLDTLRFARAALNREPKPMTSDELDWLAENRALELSWGVIDNDLSDCAWRVHRCSGGINDREWSLIAIGETPRAALAKARNELPSH